jgi:hypothetical protein
MRTTGTYFRRAGGVGIDALMHSKSQGPRRTLPGPSTFGCWPFSDQAKVRVESGRGKAQADAGRGEPTPDTMRFCGARIRSVWSWR